MKKFLCFMIMVLLSGVLCAQTSMSKKNRAIREFANEKAPTPQMKEAAMEAVTSSKILYLGYENMSGLEGDTGRRNIEKLKQAVEKENAQVEIVWDETVVDEYPQFFITMDTSKVAKDKWLEVITLPTKVNYDLMGVSIVLDPPASVKRQSLENLKTAVFTIAEELRKLRDDYPQLQQFTNDNISLGGWKEGEAWPNFPTIEFRYGMEKNEEGAWEPDAPNWLEVRLWVEPITGEKKTDKLIRPKTYYKQGIQVNYVIKNDNSQIKLRNQINMIINRALMNLFELEKQI